MTEALATGTHAIPPKDGRQDQRHHPGWLDDQLLRNGLLAALTAAAAILNATAYIALGKVFASFMTGNIVFLGIELAGWTDGPSIWKPLIALAAFGFGAAMAARFVKSDPTDDTLWSLETTRVLLAVGCLQIAYLALWMVTSDQFSNTVAMVLIGISALSMGLQTGAVFFSLGVRAVFTTAATATLVLFAGDIEARSRARHELPRLIAVLGSVFIGSLVGALLVLHAESWAPLPALILTWSVIAVAVSRFHRDLLARSSFEFLLRLVKGDEVAEPDGEHISARRR